MKLTKRKLRKIVHEEIKKLSESTDITITIADDLYRELKRQADEHGITVKEFINSTIERTTRRM